MAGVLQAAHARTPGRKIVLKFATEQGLQACDFTEVILYADPDTGRFRNAIPATPALLNWPHVADAFGLRLHAPVGKSVLTDGTKLTGSLRVGIVWPDSGAGKFGWAGTDYRYELDAVLKDNGLQGTFACSFIKGEGTRTPKRVTLRGRVSGRVIPLDEPPVPGADFAPGRDWPRWRGPYNTSLAPPCGEEMVDSLGQARLRWRSEEKVTDSAGTLCAYGGGGFGSPLVINGRVYIYYYEPSGKALDRGKLRIARTQGRHDRSFWGVMADSVVLCIDGRTGRTIWKTAFVARAVSMHGGTKHGGHFSPTSDDGKIYVLSPGGVLHAVDAETGQPLWEANIGFRAAAERHHGRFSARRGAVAYYSWDWLNSPMAGGGVVVCNDSAEWKMGPRHQGGQGFIAFDGNTGERLWRIRGIANLATTPLLWKHKEKHYFIAVGGEDRGAVCIEPRTGKILWETTEKVGGVCIASENELVCGSSGDEGPTCFDITPAGAVKRWAMPKEYRYSYNTPALADGYLYCGGLFCVDMKTGKVVAKSKRWKGRSCGSIVLGDGRVVMESAGSVGYKVLMFKARPDDVRELGSTQYGRFANSTTTAMADGRVFWRTREGVICYDLRKRFARPKPDRKAMLQLIEQDYDSHLRVAAIEALQQGEDADGLAEALTWAYKNPESRLFEPVLAALGRTGAAGGAAAVPILIEIVEKQDRKFFQDAVATLSRMGPGMRQKMTPLLLRSLRSGDTVIFDTSLRTLMAQPVETRKQVLEALMEVLEKGRPKHWSAAMDAVARIDPESHDRVTRTLLASVASRDANRVNAAAPRIATLLPKVTDRELRMEIVTASRKIIEGRLTTVKVEAANLLAAFGKEAKPTAPALREALLGSKRGAVQKALAAALKKIEPDKPLTYDPSREKDDLGLSL